MYIGNDLGFLPALPTLATVGSVAGAGTGVLSFGQQIASMFGGGESKAEHQAKVAAEATQKSKQILANIKTQADICRAIKGMAKEGTHGYLVGNQGAISAQGRAAYMASCEISRMVGGPTPGNCQPYGKPIGSKIELNQFFPKIAPSMNCEEPGIQSINIAGLKINPLVIGAGILGFLLLR